MIGRSEQVLCEMQGRIFCESAEKGYDSKSFIRTYLNSPVVKDLDKPFHFMQWAGEAYIMARLTEECGQNWCAEEPPTAEKRSTGSATLHDSGITIQERAVGKSYVKLHRILCGLCMQCITLCVPRWQWTDGTKSMKRRDRNAPEAAQNLNPM